MIVLSILMLLWAASFLILSIVMISDRAGRITALPIGFSLFFIAGFLFCFPNTSENTDLYKSQVTKLENMVIAVDNKKIYSSSEAELYNNPDRLTIVKTKNVFGAVIESKLEVRK
jgi:hypothetical protein